MSYLNNLRLVFAGDFQADVSTINNDVRHYDNATFEPRFQEFLEPAPDNPEDYKYQYNGYWNPVGSGAFRLINCSVQAVYYQDGTSTTDSSVDSAVGLSISGSNNRVGAKLVDLDPQWQASSEIWGLTIRLNDINGNDKLVGQFEPVAFRDIWFGRQQGDIADLDQTASAAFQSVLTNLLIQDVSTSQFLQELKAATEAASETDRLLSIRLTTFGYKRDSGVNRFTLGRLVGAIGLYTPNEPRSFVLGRRMVPKLRLINGNPIHNINFFDCQVDEAQRSVFVDLGNALPFTIENENQDDEKVELINLGTLQLAVLCEISDETYADEGDQVTKDTDFVTLGSTISYLEPDWLNQTAGIFSVQNIPESIYSLVVQQPLALIEMTDENHGVVLVRESANGWLLRAENFVHRVEPGYPALTTMFASCYGKPLPNAEVLVSLEQPADDSGMGPGYNDPTAHIPYTNTPTSGLILPSTLQTDDEGKALLTIGTANPNNPRIYIDGQVYQVKYQLQEQPDDQQHIFDCIILLLYNAYQVPEQPTWIDHIKPIFQQYSNLYPIMSEKLVDLGNYESVKEHRAILELAFSLDPSDPNYMPVTRDLSAPKRKTILKWLCQKSPDGEYILFYGSAPQDIETIIPPAKVGVRRTVVSSSIPKQSKDIGSKAQFYKNVKAAQQAARELCQVNNEKKKLFSPHSSHTSHTPPSLPTQQSWFDRLLSTVFKLFSRSD